MTFEEFERLPGKLELLEGELVGFPVPKLPVPDFSHSMKAQYLLLRLLRELQASAGGQAEELDDRTRLFFEHGAREIWRAYLRTRHITVHVPGRAHDVGDNDTLTTPLIPGLALSVRDILAA